MQVASDRDDVAHFINTLPRRVMNPSAYVILFRCERPQNSQDLVFLDANTHITSRCRVRESHPSLSMVPPPLSKPGIINRMLPIRSSSQTWNRLAVGRPDEQQGPWDYSGKGLSISLGSWCIIDFSPTFRIATRVIRNPHYLPRCAKVGVVNFKSGMQLTELKVLSRSTPMPNPRVTINPFR